MYLLETAPGVRFWALPGEGLRFSGPGAPRRPPGAQNSRNFALRGPRGAPLPSESPATGKSGIFCSRAPLREALVQCAGMSTACTFVRTGSHSGRGRCSRDCRVASSGGGYPPRPRAGRAGPPSSGNPRSPRPGPRGWNSQENSSRASCRGDCGAASAPPAHSRSPGAPSPRRRPGPPMGESPRIPLEHPRDWP